MRFRPSLTLSICLLAATLAIVGLFRTTASTAPPVAGPDTSTITIEGFAFSTLDLTGTDAAITVTNLDSAAHTLTAVGGAFDTGLIGGNASASFITPPTAGTYEFFCELHPSMTGALIVG